MRQEGRFVVLLVFLPTLRTTSGPFCIDRQDWTGSRYDLAENSIGMELGSRAGL